jgi:hypothetical protein
MNHHASNRAGKEVIAASIPWNPVAYLNQARVGDWINSKRPTSNIALKRVYQVTQTSPSMVQVTEYKKISRSGLIQVVKQQEVTLSTESYFPIRVLTQKNHGSPLKAARDLPNPSKPTPLLWIFEPGFIEGLPWDPGEWHWQDSPGMGDSLFFGYTTKRAYRNARKQTHILTIRSCIQNLNLQNSSIAQVITSIWHNSRP